MRKILQIASVFVFALFYTQNVTDYQYISLRNGDLKDNKYGVENVLKSSLTQKKYTVISPNLEEWPIELRQNPCNVLIAELENTSSMFRNKVALNFKDCNNKSLAKLEGKSFIKDFDPGMQDAMKDALKLMKNSEPTTKEWIAEEKPKPTSTIIDKDKTEIISQNSTIAETAKKTSEVQQQKLSNSTETSNAEIYSNGNFTFNKINLSNGEFILVNPNNSIPYATFKPSAKKEVFRVQLQDGTTTLGYLEAGKIIIEIPNSDGSFRNEVFLKK